MPTRPFEEIMICVKVIFNECFAQDFFSFTLPEAVDCHPGNRTILTISSMSFMAGNGGKSADGFNIVK